MAALGIEVRTTLLPPAPARPRARPPALRHLRWLVVLALGGRDVLAEYSTGAPAPLVPRRPGAPPDHELRDFEIEYGLHAYRSASGEIVPGEEIRPDPAEVVADVLLDVEAIDALSFEDWATRLGIGPTADRCDEALYRQGLELGSEMQVALGGAGLATLRRAARAVLDPARRALGHAVHRVRMRDDRRADDAPGVAREQGAGRDPGPDASLAPPPLTEVFVLSCVLEAGMDALGARRRDGRWEIALADGCDYDRLARLSGLLRTTRIWLRPDAEPAGDGETTAATDGLVLTIGDGATW